jgi:hypothetical protein
LSEIENKLTPWPDDRFTADDFAAYQTAIRAVTEILDDRYAGFWIERVDGGRIGKIAVVSPTDDDQHEVSRRVGRFGRSVLVVSARYSLDELRAFEAAVKGLLAKPEVREALADASYSTMIGVDVTKNAVLVRGNPTAIDVVNRELRNVIPSEALVTVPQRIKGFGLSS